MEYEGVDKAYKGLILKILTEIMHFSSHQLVSIDWSSIKVALAPWRASGASPNLLPIAVIPNCHKQTRQSAALECDSNRVSRILEGLTLLRRKHLMHNHMKIAVLPKNIAHSRYSLCCQKKSKIRRNSNRNHLGNAAKNIAQMENQ